MNIVDPDYRRAAPFFGRLLLASKDQDALAAQAALQDADAADVGIMLLLVMSMKALTPKLDADNPEWAEQVRQGLLESQAL